MSKKAKWFVRGCAASMFVGFALLCVVSSVGAVAIFRTVIV